MNSGIYSIENIITKKPYIGSTQDFDERKYSHFWHLERNVHSNKHLQAAYNKYGKDAFEFNILDTTPIENLLIKEQEYFDTLLFAQEYINSKGKDNRFKKLSYNISPVANRYVFLEFTKEILDKLSVAAKELWTKPEYIAKQAAAYTEERKRLVVEKRTITINKNKDEFYNKINETKRINLLDETFYNNWYNKLFSIEATNKRSVSMKKKWEDPVYRNSVINGKTSEERSAGVRKAWVNNRDKFIAALTSPKANEKRSKSQKKLLNNPEYINPHWKPVVAIDRLTNKIIHEFKMAKEAMQWASNYLGTDIRGDYYIKNNHKDYCGFKWMYKKDYKLLLN